MAFCLHKVANRLSLINPVLAQNRYFTAPANLAQDHINAKNTQRNIFASRKIEQNSHLLSYCQSKIVNQRPNIVNFSHTSINCSNAGGGSEETGGANEEQLSVVYEKLRENIPMLFVTALDYTCYHKDIVFENRIRGKTYVGILEYVKQMSFLRLYGHLKFAYVKLDVLKMTKHPEDSTIKIRWRISGISGYRVAYKMIQFRVWQPRKMIEEHQKTWIDGFSTMYVNKDGFIVRHIADKVMPDEDKETVNPVADIVNKIGNVPKLALFVKISTDLAPTIV